MYLIALTNNTQSRFICLELSFKIVSRLKLLCFKRRLANPVTCPDGRLHPPSLPRRKGRELLAVLGVTGGARAAGLPGPQPPTKMVQVRKPYSLSLVLLDTVL